MDLLEFKKQQVQQELGISKDFGVTISFIDFGNVNHWFEEDRQTHDNIALKDDEKIIIDLQKLRDFSDLLANTNRFYYGYDPKNPGSFGFIRAAREVFGKARVFTKHIQNIRHYLNEEDIKINTRIVHDDKKGKFIYSKM
jgi:hypothetical protein